VFLFVKAKKGVTFFPDLKQTFGLIGYNPLHIQRQEKSNGS